MLTYNTVAIAVYDADNNTNTDQQVQQNFF